MKTPPTWEEEYKKLIVHRGIEISAHGIFVLRDFIESLLESERKAFGNCTKCYGKGYNTQLAQMIGAEDFGGDGFVEKPKVHMNFCSCERGEQLAELLESERKELAEKVKDIRRLYADSHGSVDLIARENVLALLKTN